MLMTNYCKQCESLEDRQVFDLLKSGSLPHEIKHLTDRDGLAMQIRDACHTMNLVCANCKITYTAEEEWYEFNDSGLPFTHQVTLVRL